MQLTRVVPATPVALPAGLPGVRVRPRPEDPDEALIARAGRLGRRHAADRVAAALGGFRIDELDQVLDGNTCCVLEVDTHFLERLDILDRLDTAFLGTEAVPPRIRLADGTKRDRVDQEPRVIRPARMEQGGRLFPAGAVEVLAEGVTVVLNDVAPLVRGELLEFSQDLSRVRDVQTQVNCYTSERDATGFGRHWDDHDVVIIQVLGRKRWQIHQPGALSPLMPWTDSEACGDAVLSVVLEPGMGLFIPRGWPHEVRGFPGVMSCHLTVGTRRQLMMDALAESLDHLGPGGDAFNEGVPAWRELGAGALETSLARQRARIECVPFLGPFAVGRELARLGPDSLVSGQLPGGIVFADPDGAGDAVHVVVDGVAYGILRSFAPVMARLAENRPVTVAELAATVGGDTGGVVSLLRTLASRDIIRFHGSVAEAPAPGGGPVR